MMPTDAEPYYQVGLAFLGNHSYENAVAAFQKALSLNPNHRGAQLKLAALMTTSPQQSVLQDAKKRLEDLLGDRGQHFTLRLGACDKIRGTATPNLNLHVKECCRCHRFR
jgi:cytochrome c-type biogenesis protein CcmH/NrfG